ncbi:hypothetical protein ABID22_004079 [Pontibacter aydingkolensis]
MKNACFNLHTYFLFERSRKGKYGASFSEILRDRLTG